MKRKILIIILLYSIYFLTGCVADSNIDKNQDTSVKTNNMQNGNTENIAPDVKNLQEAKGDNHKSQTDKNSNTVIIKSGGKVSDEESEEVLNELDKELDKVIDAIDSLNEANEEELSY